MVNGKRAMRYDYANYTYDTANAYYYEGNNITGGYAGNSIRTGVVGGVVAGGGLVDSSNGKAYPNKVNSQGGTVSGGINNQAGSIADVVTAYAYATVGGGSTNSAYGYASTISGGQLNTTILDNTTVGGRQWGTPLTALSPPFPADTAIPRLARTVSRRVAARRQITMAPS